VSSAEIAARIVKDLEREEFRVLRAMETLLRDHESLTVEQISARAGMHPDRISFSMGRLNQMELVIKAGKKYLLVSAGLDALALKTLADKNIVTGMGGSIGVGKESDVFEAITPDQRRMAIKFFRIGRTSFRDVARKRAFGKKLHHWLLVNMDAARKEFHALQVLKKHGVRVPEPFALVKHAIVMELVEGPRLVHCERLHDPNTVLEDILSNVKLAYRAGIISADLSEYNVLHDGSDVWIIDWPQSVSVQHPNASTLLRRDLQNMLNFFRRKYGVKYVLTDAMEYVSK
jgi:RIO kinase 2